MTRKYISKNKRYCEAKMDCSSPVVAYFRSTESNTIYGACKRHAKEWNSTKSLIKLSDDEVKLLEVIES